MPKFFLNLHLCFMDLPLQKGLCSSKHHSSVYSEFRVSVPSLRFIGLQLCALRLFLVFGIVPLKRLGLAFVVLTCSYQAEDESCGDESLNCCTAPFPADVVEKETGEAGAEEASDSKCCRSEGGDKGVSLYVFWVSRHLQSGIEGT